MKEELFSLKRKWLKAKFALDMAYVSTLLDTFIGISANRISKAGKNGVFILPAAVDGLKIELVQE